MGNRNRGQSVQKGNLGTPRTETRVVAASFEGPLPLPEVFAKYDQVLPGAAERILAMAERQSEHRQGIEKVMFRAMSRDSLLGVIFGFVVAMTAVLAGAYVAVQGKQPWPGALLGSAGLVGLVGVFIYGTSANKRNGGKED